MSTKKQSSEAKPPATEPQIQVAEAGGPGNERPTRFHCPYRQASLLQQALTSNKMRVAFFLGAGCPLGIRVPSGGGATKPLIPDIANLTKEVRRRLENSEKHKDGFQAIIKRLTAANHEHPNIEHILSHIRALFDVIGGGTIDGLTGQILRKLDEEICDVTTEVVQARLPGDDTPYHRLARWIGGINRDRAVEIFTLNYDLLAEQALEQARVPYFDGFVGADRTFFDLTSMEQDNLPPRWARLWKVHGSINWWKTPQGDVERSGIAKREDGSRQMIYPSHLKYYESRRLPYLAMVDRLKAFLSHGQAVFITCGYSFSDEHINEVILQGLNGNPTAVCFALLHGDRASYPEAVSRARKQPNLSLLAADGAVLNTVELGWHSEPRGESPFHEIAVKTGDMHGRSSAAPGSCKFVLGDFVAYGEFLMQQLEFRDGSSGASDGK